MEIYGSYQLVKPLATGGMAQIFLAREQGAEAARQYLAHVWGHVGTRFRIFAENTRPGKARP